MLDEVETLYRDSSILFVEILQFFLNTLALVFDFANFIIIFYYRATDT